MENSSLQFDNIQKKQAGRTFKNPGGSFVEKKSQCFQRKGKRELDMEGTTFVTV